MTGVICARDVGGSCLARGTLWKMGISEATKGRAVKIQVLAKGLAASCAVIGAMTFVAPIAMASASPLDVAPPTTAPIVLPAPVSTAVATSVTLSIVSPYVRPGQRTEATATVKPHIAGLIVTLKKITRGHLVGVVHAQTNAKGVAVLRAAYAKVGVVPLRAFVQATPTSLASSSTRVDEHVAEQLPLTLGPLVRLALNSRGPDVLLLQQRLSELGYWLGTPNGIFGNDTQQAVYALQKVAGITPTGIVGPAFTQALNDRLLPTPRTHSGDVVEVDLTSDVVMFVHDGTVQNVLNTSTGGGYTYTQDNHSYVAETPTGIYHISRAVDGLVTDSLGQLWRPRFFVDGYAIHGDSFVPSYPESHGCVRVSNDAINWIWATNKLPFGREVWVYHTT